MTHVFSLRLPRPAFAAVKVGAASLALACLVAGGGGALRAGDKPAPARLEPLVLTPYEFGMVVELAQVKVHILNDKGDKTMVVRRRDGGGTGTEPDKQGLAYGWVELDKLDNHKDMKLADEVLPVRMAVVVVAIPYKRQLIEFQDALHLPTLAALLADKESSPRFEGLLVERQEISPDGKEKGWQKLDLERTIRPLFFLTGARFEPEESQLQKVIFGGLVTPRPLQFRSNAYQKVEAQLPHLESTLAELKKAEQPGRPGKEPVIPEYCLARFLDVTIERGKTYEYRFKIKMHNPNHKRTDVAFPEIAESGHLLSPKWVRVPGRLAVDLALHYYPVDQEALDREALPAREFASRWGSTRAPRAGQVMFQAHRWVDLVYPDPANRRTSYAVGDWVIAERYAVFRGEQVAQFVKTEVPVWSFTEEKFVLATAGKVRALPVFFGDNDNPEQSPLLVDFEGGEQSHVRWEPSDGREDELKARKVTDRAPVEVLLLTPEGKLLARDSKQDARDAERTTRLAAWRKQVTALREKEEPAAPDK
jgi:hypothetical protein